jgi:predicted RNA-binding Zn ribbon-like protein
MNVMTASDMASANDRLAGSSRASAGSLCLDLLATIEDPAGKRLDRLSTTSELVDWFGVVGLPEPAGGFTASDLDDTRLLRATVDAIARAVIAGTAPDPATVRALNNVAQHATPVFLMRSSGREQVAISEVDAAAALAVIARDTVNLLTGPEIVRLRACEGCDALFYDRSPSGRRRWCSMQRCGERVASASYRLRIASRAAIASA